MKKLFTLLFAVISVQVSIAQNFAILLYEDFESGVLPVDWTRSQAIGSDGWIFGQTSYTSSYWTVPASIDASQFAISNDDDCNCDMSDDQLNSPVMDLSGFDSAYFLFDRFFNGEWSSQAFLQISYDAGVNWLYLELDPDAAWLEDGYSIPAQIVVDNVTYTFNDQMKIGFVHYDGETWASGFAVDNVVVAGFNNPCDDIVNIPACGSSQTVTLAGAGVLDFFFTGPCGFEVGGQEQLYSFTPTVSGVHTLEVTAATGNSWLDYMFKPASAGCDSLGWTCVVDNDTIGSYAMSLTAGIQYLILVDNEFVNSETQTFSIQCPCTYTSGGNTAESEACGTDVNGGCLNTGTPTYEPIACGGSISGTLWADAGTRDLDWFQLVVTENTTIEVEFSGAPPLAAALTDNCANIATPLITETSVACGSGTLSYAVTPGTYILAIFPLTFEGYPCGSGSNAYDATVTYCESSVPDNDLCSGAIPVTCGSSVVGSNVGATISAPSDCAYLGIGEGIWYSFAGNGNLVTATTCSNSTEFDTEMAVFTGDCNNLVCEVGNDDDASCVSSNLSSTTSFVAQQGSTYYIYVGSWYESAGVFGNIGLSLSCATPAPNNECAGAQQLSVGTTCTSVSGNVLNSTESMEGCEGTANDDVWFSFTATSNEATVDVTGSASFDAVVEVFEGGCAGTSLACEDATLAAGLETITLSALTIGQVYHVRVYDYYTAIPATTTFDICVYSSPITGLNDAIDGDVSVYPNPSKGQFIVEMENVENHADLTVTDVAGRQVYAQTFAGNGTMKQSVDLDLSPGSYLVKIATGDRTHLRTIVLQ